MPHICVARLVLWAWSMSLIFCDRWTVESVRPLPSEESLESVESLPSDVHPSDHLPLLATLSLLENKTIRTNSESEAAVATQATTTAET